VIDWPTSLAIGAIVSPVIIAAWKYIPGRQSDARIAVVEAEHMLIQQMLKEDIEELKALFTALKQEVQQDLRELARGQQELREMVIEKMFKRGPD